MDDTDFYLKVSETFSEIMRQVRFYPYPAMLYKIAFNKYLHGETPQSQATAPLKRGAQKEKEVEKEVEKKEEKADSPSVASDSSPSREQNFSPDRGSGKAEGGNAKDWDLWERVISQIQSSTTRQVFKDHMTIDKVTDNEVSLIHDNNMIAKTMLEKERKEIEALLEKELSKKVTLNVQWMTKEEYFQRLMWM